MTTDERIDKVKDELANTLAEISSLDDKLTAMTTKVNELQTELAELKKQAEDEKFPKIGGTYYAIDIDGEVLPTTWCEDEWDCRRVAFGNVFETAEEAEKTVEFLKDNHEKLAVLRDLSEFAEPDDTTWINREHWYVSCDMDTGELSYRYSNFTVTSGAFVSDKCPMIYFVTKEDAERAVQAVGEERIKKYLFGYKGANNESNT